MSEKRNPLAGVEALTFDVFGTVVDWLGTVSRELETRAKDKGHTQSEDWVAFVIEWRKGYLYHTRRIAAGGEGTLHVDTLHREILDSILNSASWNHLSEIFPLDDRKQLTDIWHHLNGWPDSSPGLYKLKKQFIISTLSNGNVRLLVDMAKHADLPWDLVLSSELLGSYKPNPKMYLGAAQNLGIPPSKVAMVAAHVEDLRAAARHGMKTVYIRRWNEWSRDEKKVVEDESHVEEEFDVVVDSFIKLSELVAAAG